MKPCEALINAFESNISSSIEKVVPRVTRTGFAWSLLAVSLEILGLIVLLFGAESVISCVGVVWSTHGRIGIWSELCMRAQKMTWKARGNLAGAFGRTLHCGCSGQNKNGWRDAKTWFVSMILYNRFLKKMTSRSTKLIRWPPLWKGNETNAKLRVKVWRAFIERHFG